MSTDLRLSEHLRAVLLSLLRQSGRPMTTEELVRALRQAAEERSS